MGFFFGNDPGDLNPANSGLGQTTGDPGPVSGDEKPLDGSFEAVVGLRTEFSRFMGRHRSGGIGSDGVDAIALLRGGTSLDKKTIIMISLLPWNQGEKRKNGVLENPIFCRLISNHSVRTGRISWMRPGSISPSMTKGRISPVNLTKTCSETNVFRASRKYLELKAILMGTPAAFSAG